MILLPEGQRLVFVVLAHLLGISIAFMIVIGLAQAIINSIDKMTSKMEEI